MGDEFKIFIRRLTGGKQEDIEERLAPDFIDPQDPEIIFEGLVEIKGVAELAGETLVLRLKVDVVVTLSCAVCCERVKLPLHLASFCHTEESEGLRSGVFDFCEPLREAILLELPMRAECNQERCPHRAHLSPFLIGESYGCTT